MKKISAVLIYIGAVCLMLALLWLAGALLPLPNAYAQFKGFFSQQTVAQTFSLVSASTDVHYSLQSRNLGQAAHTIIFNAPSAQIGQLTLDFSMDDKNWYILASLNGLTSGPSSANASGWFPYIRITVPGQSSPSKQGITVSGTYIGYQFAPPGFPGADADALRFHPLQIGPIASVVAVGMPYAIDSGQCYNPNTSAAFIQLFDSTTTPTLGTGEFYEEGVAAGAVWTYDSPPAIGTSNFYAGAATTFGGSTAVTTDLSCTFTVTTNTQVFPRLIAAP